MSRPLLAASIAILLGAVSHAGPDPVVTPKAGSKERRAILDAVRLATSKSLKHRPVSFKVTHVARQGSWAFLTGVPKQPGGKPFDYRGTQYEPQIEAEIFDDWICALIKLEKGKWRAVEWQIGATDVPWDGWWTKYKAPRAIFPK